MDKFLQNVCGFVLGTGVLLGSSMFLIGSPEMRGSLLYEAKAKNARLRSLPSPKLVFVGGSNLSHGLNSERISQAFDLPVVNMGLHGGLGLSYMLSEAECHIQARDIVVVVPEYAQFEDTFYGNVELLGLIFDVLPENKHLLAWADWVRLLQHVPHYAAKKAYNAAARWVLPVRPTTPRISAYNELGDHTGHWHVQSEVAVTPGRIIERVRLEEAAFERIEKFVEAMTARGAHCYLLPPCYQASAFSHQQKMIKAVAGECLRRGLPLIAEPSRYQMSDDLFFDTIYHLKKEGVEIRTTRVIEDLKRMSGAETTDR